MIHDRVKADWPVLYSPDQLPYGLGPRVPMMAISPWSKGGYVCSEVFDHTSVIRFIEKRFGVNEPNIAAWRRAVCGDLTSAFDFTRPDERQVFLPSTANYVATVHHESTLPAPVVPVEQETAINPQEIALRRRRPIAYDTRMQLEATETGVRLKIHNPSTVGVVCTAYWDASYELPYHYTIGSNNQIEDELTIPKAHKLAFTVYGSDGYLRKLLGSGPSKLLIEGIPQKNGDIEIHFLNHNAQIQVIHISDCSYGQESRTFKLEGGSMMHIIWPLAKSHHWYDLEIKTESHTWHMAGHIETGKESWSDPANKSPVLA